MIMYVGLFGHFAVVFHAFMFFHVFVCFTDCFCGRVLSVLSVYLFSCIAASLFNKLTCLLTRSGAKAAAA